ncbi:hypothetical protein EYC84_006601 [Monilinia fructicola]|uniref:Uncharacterized protein n=1 Tax=Monilinia fructicola TaxID=38448 RepID=A0A5M9K7N7_MONFR|nr:hypothetical protein EYC84_006601 [Monilinia fructicola]
MVLSMSFTRSPRIHCPRRLFYPKSNPKSEAITSWPKSARLVWTLYLRKCVQSAKVKGAYSSEFFEVGRSLSNVLHVIMKNLPSFHRKFIIMAEMQCKCNSIFNDIQTPRPRILTPLFDKPIRPSHGGLFVKSNL